MDHGTAKTKYFNRLFIRDSCVSLGSFCAIKPCVNNGTCHENNDDITCTCANGFTGKRCEIKMQGKKTDLYVRRTDISSKAKPSLVEFGSTLLLNFIDMLEGLFQIKNQTLRKFNAF